MTSLQQILDTYRSNSHTGSEKGTYSDKLICTYFCHEPAALKATKDSGISNIAIPECCK